MTFKNYKHIELLEEITIPASRVRDNKIINVKDWKPTKPFRLRVKATVRRGEKRTIKKRTYTYEDINMVNALKLAQRELDDLLDSIRTELKRTEIRDDDRDEMMTLDKAFYRSLNARKLQAEADGHEFRTYDQTEAFYKNHLKKPLGDKPLDKITTDMLNAIRANMKHPDGTPYSKKTKLSVLQNVNPVYTWFNDYSNLKAKTPAKIKKGTLSKLDNKRKVKVDDIGPLFKAMYNYSYDKWGVEKSSPYREIFTWLLHGRRVGEVLSLDWSDIDLKAGTYTVTEEKNKAKMRMTYKLTKYQLATLGKPKKSGLVFPALSDPKKEISLTVLWDHFKKVREAVSDWKLNDKTVGPGELRIHDIRHLVGTELLNKYGYNDAIIAVVLGHKRTGTTAIYAEVTADSVHDAITTMLKGVLE